MIIYEIAAWLAWVGVLICGFCVGLSVPDFHGAWLWSAFWMAATVIACIVRVVQTA